MMMFGLWSKNRLGAGRGGYLFFIIFIVLCLCLLPLAYRLKIKSCPGSVWVRGGTFFCFLVQISRSVLLLLRRASSSVRSQSLRPSAPSRYARAFPVDTPERSPSARRRGAREGIQARQWRQGTQSKQGGPRGVAPKSGAGAGRYF